MGFKEKIKSLLQQGSLYRTQGLLTEARAKYVEAQTLIEKNEHIKNKESLLKGIHKKLQSVDKEVDTVENAPMTPEISEKIQDLIKHQFAFADDKDAAALEGAIALAKFGQFERALQEFLSLVDREAIRVDAAKNVIRCHLALASMEDAVKQYGKWMSSGVFSSGQLGKIRVFFEATLEREGIVLELPDDKTEETDAPVIEMPDIEIEEAAVPDEIEIEIPASATESSDDDEILDINSIGITMESRSKEDETIELNVSFQSGNIISLLIPGRDTKILDYLEVDKILNNAQFYSPIAIFNGTGVVAAKTKITSGPRQGDYSVDIKVVST